jgi:hypothetical protein
MFSTGTQITIFGSPARRELDTCYTQTIAFGRGEPLDRYAQLDEAQAQAISRDERAFIPARLANGRPNISGDWAADQVLYTHQEIQRNFGDVRIPDRGVGVPIGQRPNVELTNAGRRAAAARPPLPALQTDADGRPLQTGTGSLNCRPRSFFRDWTFDQHANRIIQRGDTITLQYGFMDTVRTIHMDRQEPPEGIEPSPVGYSIGAWQEDVLVVATTDFSDERFASAVPNVVRSEQYRVVERFVLDAENQTLTRSWVAEDPLYWESTVSGQDVVRRADIAWRPYGCDDRTNENVIN